MQKLGAGTKILFHIIKARADLERENHRRKNLVSVKIGIVFKIRLSRNTLPLV
jgi:hypothetical protein